MYLEGFNLAFRKQEFTLTAEESPAETTLKLHSLILQRMPVAQRIRSTKNPGFAYEVGGTVGGNSFQLRRDVWQAPLLAPLYIHMKGTVEAGAAPRSSRIRLRLEPGLGTMLGPLLMLVLIPLAIAWKLDMKDNVIGIRMLMGPFFLLYPLAYRLFWHKVIAETGQKFSLYLLARVEKHRFCSFFTGK